VGRGGGIEHDLRQNAVAPPPLHFGGHAPGEVVGHRDVRGHGLAGVPVGVNASASQPPPTALVFQAQPVADLLHDQQDGAALRPTEGPEPTEELERMPQHVAQKPQGPRPGLAASGEHCAQQVHDVLTLGIVHRLDVGVGVGINTRGDGQALGIVHGLPPRLDTDERLAVGPHHIAQLVGDARQRSPRLAAVEQFQRSQGATREDDSFGVVAPARTQQPGDPPGDHVIPVAA